MTATTETYNAKWLIQRNRRVTRLWDGKYYVQQFDHNSGQTYAEGAWHIASKGYVHSTSAFAALGRIVNKDQQKERY